MISHGMPGKLVGKGKIANDKQFLLFQQLFNPFQMIKVWAGLNWKYLQKTNRSKSNTRTVFFHRMENIEKKKKEGKLLVNSIFCFSLKVFFKSFHHQSALFS